MCQSSYILLTPKAMQLDFLSFTEIHQVVYETFCEQTKKNMYTTTLNPKGFKGDVSCEIHFFLFKNTLMIWKRNDIKLTIKYILLCNWILKECQKFELSRSQCCLDIDIFWVGHIFQFVHFSPFSIMFSIILFAELLIKSFCSVTT